MRVVVQRSLDSYVLVNGKITGSIDKGLVVLVGFTHDDDINDIDYIVKKIINLRIFDDKDGVMNLSIKDIQGEILIVSQFTLCGCVKKGTRPSFDNAMKPDEANEMYEYFIEKVKQQNIPVKTGVFGAHMDIQLLNDGPVTFVIEAPIF